jgi:hypothetical protein
MTSDQALKPMSLLHPTHRSLGKYRLEPNPPFGMARYCVVCPPKHARPNAIRCRRVCCTCLRVVAFSYHDAAPPRQAMSTKSPSVLKQRLVTMWSSMFRQILKRLVPRRLLLETTLLSVCVNLCVCVCVCVCACLTLAPRTAERAIIDLLLLL